MPRRKQPAIPDELLDQFLAGSDPRAALADGGLLDGLKKALAERVLNAELDHHLDGGEPDGRAQWPQRLWRQDGADRHRQARAADPARPAGDLRSAADRQVPAALPRLRRADRVDVCPRHEHPRDPGASARDLRHRHLARPGQRGDRRRARRGRRVAEPAARGALPAGLPRRAAGQGARRGHGPQQGGLCRARRPPRRHQGRPRPLDRADRGRQVLAAGHERAARTAASRTFSSPWSTG